MISPGRHVSDPEPISALSSAALEAYRYAVECAAQYAAPARDDHTKAHKANLARILATLGTNPHPEDFERNRTLLRAELRDYHDLLIKHHSETRHGSDLDPLTGFATRAAFERRMGQCIAAGSPFAIVYVLLENARSLVRQRGRVGEEVVSAAAKRIAHTVEPARSGRWSDDEFVLLCGNLEQALAASHKLSYKLTGEYVGRENPVTLVRLHLRVRTGVVQCAGLLDTAAVLEKIEEMVKAFDGG